MSRRRFKQLKRVKPISGLGNYEVTLKIENLISHEQDIPLRDYLPPNFKITTCKHEYRKTEVDDGIILDFGKIKVGPGETRKIEYEVKGEGDYSPKELQISY